MRTEPQPRSRAFPARPGQAAVVIIAFTCLLYVVEAFDTMLGGALEDEGIDPRSLDGLDGVLWAPLLHGPWSHLVSNTVPVLALGFLVLANGLRQFVGVTAVIWLVGGAGTWLMAGGAGGGVHIGASILVFGWMLFLLARGFYTRSAGQITLGVTLFLFWGGLLWGVLPTTPGVSWEGHLFGAIGGLIAAHFVDRTDRSPRR
ncbi:MAG: rhomboid family intramembrane serine protease [Pseudonocardiaceae bacterium]|nr:rhomboid family intramembrane serine protease [Pseudonocardiaceae bacterium]